LKKVEVGITQNSFLNHDVVLLVDFHPMHPDVVADLDGIGRVDDVSDLIDVGAKTIADRLQHAGAVGLGGERRIGIGIDRNHRAGRKSRPGGA